MCIRQVQLPASAAGALFPLTSLLKVAIMREVCMGSQPWASRPLGRTSTSWSLPGVRCFIIQVSIDTVLVVTCV